MSAIVTTMGQKQYKVDQESVVAKVVTISDARCNLFISFLLLMSLAENKALLLPLPLSLSLRLSRHQRTDGAVAACTAASAGVKLRGAMYQVSCDQ